MTLAIITEPIIEFEKIIRIYFKMPKSPFNGGDSRYKSVILKKGREDGLIE